MSTEVAFFALLFLAAALADALFPQRGRSWDNSKGATQRQVADVLRTGGKQSADEPRIAPLIAILVIVAAALVFAGGLE